MGAEQFCVSYKGTSVSQAFRQAVADAHYDYGHAGYTGTIAEKHGYVEFIVPEGYKVKDIVNALAASYAGAPSDELTEAYGEDDAADIFSIYDDKWGPAVALPDGEGRWVFCGWASS